MSPAQSPPDEVKEGVIEADKKPEEVPKDPVPLHKDFRWVTVDLTNPDEVSLPTRLGRSGT